MAGRALVPVMLALCELVADGQAACESYGLLRGTAVFDRCVRDEFAARRPG